MLANEQCYIKNLRDQAQLQKCILFQVNRIGAFLDSLKPHVVANMFSGLNKRAHIRKRVEIGHDWFTGQNFTGLMCMRGFTHTVTRTHVMTHTHILHIHIHI